MTDAELTDLASIIRLANERDRLKCELDRQRELSLQLAERILAAHEVLARLAERRNDVHQQYPGDSVARQAFDVMMRRGWSAIELSGNWMVDMGFNPIKQWFNADDPFTVLVEADEWYKDNVENK